MTENIQKQHRASYIRSEDDSRVELQSGFILLVDLLLSLRANFTFGLMGKTQRAMTALPYVSKHFN